MSDNVIFRLPDMNRAIIGTVSVEGDVRIVYDYEKVLTQLQHQGMSYEEALDWYSHNMACAYMGPNSPLYLDRKPQGYSFKEWFEELDAMNEVPGESEETDADTKK